MWYMQLCFLTISIYKWQAFPCHAVKIRHYHLNLAVKFVNQARSYRGAVALPKLSVIAEGDAQEVGHTVSDPS